MAPAGLEREISPGSTRPIEFVAASSRRPLPGNLGSVWSGDNITHVTVASNMATAFPLTEGGIESEPDPENPGIRHLYLFKDGATVRIDPESKRHDPVLVIHRDPGQADMERYPLIQPVVDAVGQEILNYPLQDRRLLAVLDLGPDLPPIDEVFAQRMESYLELPVVYFDVASWIVTGGSFDDSLAQSILDKVSRTASGDLPPMILLFNKMEYLSKSLIGDFCSGLYGLFKDNPKASVVIPRFRGFNFNDQEMSRFLSKAITIMVDQPEE